uniref:Uncharacterized protein n=1 Tax=Arundo donax TaxID=35708 RepID=A0A0A8ZVA8_ARUDO
MVATTASSQGWDTPLFLVVRRHLSNHIEWRG